MVRNFDVREGCRSRQARQDRITPNRHERGNAALPGLPPPRPMLDETARLKVVRKMFELRAAGVGGLAAVLHRGTEHLG
jgi:hypothetical protein